MGCKRARAPRPGGRLPPPRGRFRCCPFQSQHQSNQLHRLVACDLASLFNRTDFPSMRKTCYCKLFLLLFTARLDKVLSSVLPTEEVGVETCWCASHFLQASSFVLKR